MLNNRYEIWRNPLFNSQTKHSTAQNTEDSLVDLRVSDQISNTKIVMTPYGTKTQLDEGNMTQPKKLSKKQQNIMSYFISECLQHLEFFESQFWYGILKK